MAGTFPALQGVAYWHERQTAGSGAQYATRRLQLRGLAFALRAALAGIPALAAGRLRLGLGALASALASGSHAGVARTL